MRENLISIINSSDLFPSHNSNVEDRVLSERLKFVLRILFHFLRNA